jgi:effector-binding domain-containing protein
MGQKYETQEYEVIENLDFLELRFYPPAMKVKVVTPVNSGSQFSTLFRYISGKNKENEKIAMTTPVHMHAKKDSSTMEFILPKKYISTEAPKPIENNVRVYESKAGYYAAVRYGGYSNSSKVKLHTQRLYDALKKHNVKAIGDPVILSYDSPYKIMNRRNEVLIEVEKVEKSAFIKSK